MNRNQVVLDGRICAMKPLRYTPAGLPVVEFRLSHSSEQTEAGTARQVECEVSAIAMGEPALALARLTAGEQVAVKGFLSRRSRHSDYPVLHVNQIKLAQASE